MARPPDGMALSPPDRNGFRRRALDVDGVGPGRAFAHRCPVHHHERLSARAAGRSGRRRHAADVGARDGAGRQAAGRAAAEPARHGAGRGRHPEGEGGRDAGDVADRAGHAPPDLRHGGGRGRDLYAGEPERPRPSRVPVPHHVGRPDIGFSCEPSGAADQPRPLPHADRRGGPDPLGRGVPAVDRRGAGGGHARALRTRHGRSRMACRCPRARPDGL